MALNDVSSDVGQWLEYELERLGVPSSQRRRTRVTLAARLAAAMRGQLNAYPPHEAVVLEAAQRDTAYAFELPMAAHPSAAAEAATAPYADITSKLQKISDDVAFLQIREQASEVREAYRRRVARREEKIKDLQLIVHELQEELHEVREGAARTQRKLEDACSNDREDHRAQRGCSGRPPCVNEQPRSRCMKHRAR